MTRWAAVYRLLGGNLVFGKSRGSLSFAILRWAAMAFVGSFSSAISFSVGFATRQPSSMKYCDILERRVSRCYCRTEIKNVTHCLFSILKSSRRSNVSVL